MTPGVPRREPRSDRAGTTPVGGTESRALTDTSTTTKYIEQYGETEARVQAGCHA